MRKIGVGVNGFALVVAIGQPGYLAMADGPFCAEDLDGGRQVGVEPARAVYLQGLAAFETDETGQVVLGRSFGAVVDGVNYVFGGVSPRGLGAAQPRPGEVEFMRGVLGQHPALLAVDLKPAGDALGCGAGVVFEEDAAVVGLADGAGADALAQGAIEGEVTHEITKLQGDARSIGGRCEFEHVFGADGVGLLHQQVFARCDGV